MALALWADIAAGAVVPEQLPLYVTSVAASTPERSAGDFLRYITEDSVVLVAYGAHGAPVPEEERVRAALADLPRFTRRLTLLAPFPVQTEWLASVQPEWQVTPLASPAPDAWWVLKLPAVLPFRCANTKTRNMVRRARREVTIAPENWGTDHAALVEEYLRSRCLDEGLRFVYGRLKAYLAASPDAVLRGCKCFQLFPGYYSNLLIKSKGKSDGFSFFHTSWTKFSHLGRPIHTVSRR